MFSLFCLIIINSDGNINRYKATTDIEVAPAAKYTSLVVATADILWIQTLLLELSVPHSRPR